MAEQTDTEGIERIVFEPVREGQWRMRVEGGDVEGHGARFSGLSVEPASTERGETLYSLTFDGEDVEGQALRNV